MLKLLRLTALFPLFFLTLKGQTASFENHETIYAAAREFIDQSLSSEHETSFAPLDQRLQLIACDQPLTAQSNTPSIKPGRNSIGVKCNGAKSWSLYVSAQVKIFEDVVMLKQPVQRGEVLTADHLQLSHQDTSLLRSTFIRDLNSVINKQAAHNLPQDAILNERDITQAIIIKRGEHVAITSGSPYLSIQMQGLAMMDGIQGQTIRIKNVTSGRIVSGLVTKPGVVAVGL